MKKIKKNIRLYFSNMICSMNVTTYASSYPENLGEIVDGSVLTNETSSETILDNPLEVTI